MSRSRRKTPKGGLTNSGFNRGEKDDKQIANRKLRKRNKRLVEKGEEETFIVKREASNIWDFRKDGKKRFNPKTSYGKKMMRK